MPGDIGRPLAKPTVSIHCPNPFGQEFPLRLLLLVALTLNFQNQGLAIREPNQKIRPKFIIIPLNEYVISKPMWSFFTQARTFLLRSSSRDSFASHRLS